MMGAMGQQGAPAPAMQGQMPTVDEIVALLMQGIDPQKLVEMGVPPDLIMQAIQVLEQQMAAEQQQPVNQEGGLAQAMAGM